MLTVCRIHVAREPSENDLQSRHIFWNNFPLRLSVLVTMTYNHQTWFSQHWGEGRAALTDRRIVTMREAFQRNVSEKVVCHQSPRSSVDA